MTLRYRALEEAEIGEAAELFITALGDMLRRNGMPPATGYTRAYVEPRYAQLRRAGIFRVAEADGKIVSLCAALVRGDQWFLSMFWTLPEWQRQGVGRPLLREVWQQGRDQGARVDFTWSSIDFAALCTYLRLGMLPGCQIFTFAGAPALANGTTGGYALEPLEREVLERVDGEVRGAARPADHDYFLESAAAAHQVRAGSEIAGYLFANAGVIGPAAWTRPEHARGVLEQAVRVASGQAREIRLMALGSNHDALRVALDFELRLAGTGHFLRSQAFGALDRYLPSGPVFF
jgi:GNAT superfamily N-acetyltransferase